MAKDEMTRNNIRQQKKIANNNTCINASTLFFISSSQRLLEIELRLHINSLFISLFSSKKRKEGKKKTTR